MHICMPYTYLYRFLPTRRLARTQIRGAAEADKITKAFQRVRSAITTTTSSSSSSSSSVGLSALYQTPNKLQLKAPISTDTTTTDTAGANSDSSKSSSVNNPWLGLQLCNSKVCFNPRGEPAMAAYEIQWWRRVTQVYVELQEHEQ